MLRGFQTSRLLQLHENFRERAVGRRFVDGQVDVAECFTWVADGVQQRRVKSPERAIPHRAPLGADLHQVRGLDCTACARSSQPFGFRVLGEFMAHVLEGTGPEERWERLLDRTVIEIYNDMTMMKESTLTGCSHCLDVCPVGADYDRVSGSPHRRLDLPDPLPRVVEEGWVEVGWTGPGEKRPFRWQRQTPEN